MNTHEVLILARRFVASNPTSEMNARLCLEDAVNLLEEGDLPAAKRRALKSLAYSVGIYHPSYKRASRGDKK